MSDPDPAKIAALEALYASLPTVECQGQCWNACGPISMSLVERARIEAVGVDIPEFTQERSDAWNRDEPLHCPALTQFKQCSVYAVRPLVCRVFGVARGELACRFGCTVTGTRLRTPEVMQLMVRAYRIGGYDKGMDPDDSDEQMMSDPVVSALIVRFMNGDRSLVPQIGDAMDAARKRYSGDG